MGKWLTTVTVNKKTPLEKLAATHVMFSCKSLRMILTTSDYYNMTYRICLFQNLEDMLFYEKNHRKSAP